MGRGAGNGTSAAERPRGCDGESVEKTERRGLSHVLAKLVEGRTAVRLQREHRQTLEVVFREAPAGSVITDQSTADCVLSVQLPLFPVPRAYSVTAGLNAAADRPALTLTAERQSEIP